MKTAFGSRIGNLGLRLSRAERRLIPPTSSVPTKPAEQEYHHYDDQKRIRIHGPTLLNFRDPVKWNLSLDRCWNKDRRCFGVLSGSENTLTSVLLGPSVSAEIRLRAVSLLCRARTWRDPRSAARSDCAFWSVLYPQMPAEKATILVIMADDFGIGNTRAFHPGMMGAEPVSCAVRGNRSYPQRLGSV
jgi:hypothetical protein